MGDRLPFYSFKETRLSLNSSPPSSTIAIRPPSHASLAIQTSRVPLLRRNPAKESLVAEDETVFARRLLATSASAYHRQSRRYPRSFLWRVLEDGKVLSIQAVDLSKSSEHAPEAPLILRLAFPNPVRPAGVTLSDSDLDDALNVFVVTTSNDLYTLTLSPKHFQQPSTAESSVEKWCKTFLPSSFSFRYPHRIVARSPQELLVSLHDGGLLRLTRGRDDDGSSWTETFFNEGGWGSSLRGLIPWQGSNTVRFGRMNLEQSTATDLAFSPHVGEDSPEHLFTVCLDHTLKVWNLHTGKVGSSRDLLNKPRHPHETAKYLLDPGQTSLMNIVDQRLRGERDQYYLVTFSPVGTGQFKFWAVSNADAATGVEDLYPDDVFVPPSPSSEIWTMTQFKVVPDGDPGILVIWILWKNNTSSRVQSLRLDLLRAAEDWQDAWACTAAEILPALPLPVVSHLEPLDATDKWVEYLFYPGRYTDAMLSTALSIYEQNLNVARRQSTRTTKSLQERVCLSVGSSVAVTAGSSGGADYQRFRTDADYQWRRYYRIVAELAKQSGEALSLAFDEYADIPWVVTAEGIAAVRECNVVELLHQNSATVGRFLGTLRLSRPEVFLEDQRESEFVKMAGLIGAASAFTEGFSDALLHACRTVLQSEIFQQPSFSVPVRIQSFYDRCNFLGQISDDDISQLRSSLDEIGGVKALTTDLFRAVLGRLSHAKQTPVSEAKATAFGEKVVVRAAQEIIHLNTTVLFDLLMLLVFVEVDESFGIDEDLPEDFLEGGMGRSDGHGPRINAPELYLTLLSLFRQYDVLAFLSKTSLPGKSTREAGTPTKEEASQAPSAGPGLSGLLHFPCFRAWRPRWLQPRRTMSATLTQSIDGLIGHAELEQPELYQLHLLQIQLYIIARGDLSLARQFSRYQSNDAWARYVKGRLYLMSQEYAVAAVHFKKAAFQLANRAGLDITLINDSEDLLIQEEETRYFGFNLHSYYYHIMKLFDKEGAGSYVADFAETCLHFVNAISDDDSTRKLRAEVLGHLFSSSIETSLFDRAHSALLRYPDKTKQRHALGRLVTAMCQKGEGSRLLSLPFLGLQGEVDEVLSAGSQNALSLHSGPPYHKILYAWRMQHGDFRGAAAALHGRLQRVQSAQGSFSERNDPELNGVTQGYLALINVLASVDPDQAWVLSTKQSTASKAKLSPSTQGTKPAPTPARTVVTIADIRRDYQAELDRLACIENDQFAFSGGGGGGEEMDVDVDSM
ncbi:MAG: hypothetical protein M1832_005076 [Thelocarpon impressellum]|nr:MAG: hypothetical protein M1832_005076 [Thelocarpon impressellum]